MSEMARKAREENREKAKRLTRTDPHEKVDASSWEPGEPMNAEAKRGLRPVSPRAYKRGGKVEGCKPHMRADRKPRASGGRANADAYVNRNAKEANASEFGKPHIGGYAAGGATNFRKQMHADVGEDKRLIEHMVKPNALRPKKRNGGGQWIQSAIKHPGALHEELHVPKGEKIPAKKLNKAAHSDNPKLAKRANLAKTLGRLHKATGGAIESTGMRPKGDRIPRASGGRMKGKGKTNIAIIIGSGHGQQQQPSPAAPVKPPVQPVPVPAAPPQMPAPQMAGGMPPGLGAGMMPPGMPRKSGGRTVYTDASIAKAKRVTSPKNIDVGAGGGLGRLAKTAMAERDYARAK